MKIKLFALLVVGFSAFGLKAQIAGGVNDGLNYGLTLIPTMDKNIEEVEGSPYYNEQFVRGMVHVEDKEPLQVYLRYNVAEERIEIQTHPESSKIYQLPMGSGAEYTLGSQKFVLDKISSDAAPVFGYFVELYDGDNYRLLKKPLARFTEGEIARTGYGKDTPGKITIEEEYYIVSDSGEAVNLRPKSKDVKKAYGSDKVRGYLKDNNIRSEADLVSFVAYLDKE